MDIPVAASRPRGMELLQDDLRLMVFLEIELPSIPDLALTSKAWSTTYSAHCTYINRCFLRDVIEEENMSIAIARYAASKLTWTPSPIHGFSKSCSLEELPGKPQEFGDKYLAPGAALPSDIDHKMARGMIYFHRRVRSWSSSFLQKTSWMEYLWEFGNLVANNQELSRFENSMYILEVLKLLFPVSLEDDREKDREIFTALCQFFAPWRLGIIQEFGSWMLLFCPGWQCDKILEYCYDHGFEAAYEAFMPMFSSLGDEAISKLRVDGVPEWKSLLDRMLQAERGDPFALTPRESYQCPGGTFSWLVEKGTLHHIQRADIEGLLSKYPENDTGPADSWLYHMILDSLLSPMLPRPRCNVLPLIRDRKTLEINYGETFPNRNELIDNLEGARLDYCDKQHVMLKSACAMNCAEGLACPSCQVWRIGMK